MAVLKGKGGQWHPSYGNPSAGQRSSPFPGGELGEILKAYAAITSAFAILMLGGFGLFTAKPGEIIQALLISAFTVGVGFVLHELAHRHVARRYGCQAEFRAFPPFLAIAIASAFFGFIFAAPGAVFISGSVRRKESARIAASGPAMNIAVAFFFIALHFLLPVRAVEQVTFYGASINAFLAFFNLIPFGGFDGLKVLRGDQKLFYLLMLASLAALIVANTLPPV